MICTDYVNRIFQIKTSGMRIGSNPSSHKWAGSEKLTGCDLGRPILSAEGFPFARSNGVSWVESAKVGERVRKSVVERERGNEMWLGGGSSGGAAAVKTAFVIVRYFSRERAPNLRKINPKLPPQEASSIAQGLYHVIKQQGPLSVTDTWNHAQFFLYFHFHIFFKYPVWGFSYIYLYE